MTSTPKPITRGVPQGSILGPILFILYCTDIKDCFKKCRYHIYADDVQVYISFEPKDYAGAVKDLNEELSEIAKWSENNCLVLNPSKTKYLLLGSAGALQHIPDTLHVKLLNELVERVDAARNLGLHFDASLRYEGHVASTVQNCFYRLKVLYRIRPFISEELRVRLIESLVLSKLSYADVVYGPRLLARTNRLIQRLQNACARFCFTIPSRSHVTPFLNDHNILKMKSRRKLHLASLLFGVIKSGEPTYLYSKLVWFDGRRGDGGRQKAKQLTTAPHRSALFRGSFRYAASKIWNNIPPPVRNCNTLFAFKKHLRQFLVDAQRRLGSVNMDVSHV